MFILIRILGSTRNVETKQTMNVVDGKASIFLVYILRVAHPSYENQFLSRSLERTDGRRRGAEGSSRVMIPKLGIWIGSIFLVMA
mmetsp:Transcript_1720/g.3182  ORF Transcript_1720/g.3182 Transcript_1720/m.3182 type:complete len:85 (+) Transcript_1720:3888-4142(+)